jgi:hypothetical protein
VTYDNIAGTVTYSQAPPDQTNDDQPYGPQNFWYALGNIVLGHCARTPGPGSDSVTVQEFGPGPVATGVSGSWVLQSGAPNLFEAGVGGSLPPTATSFSIDGQTIGFSWTNSLLVGLNPTCVTATGTLGGVNAGSLGLQFYFPGDTPKPLPVKLPKILLSRVGNSQPSTAFKPRNFYPSSHYIARRAHWSSWTRQKAVASARLGSEFQGPTHWVNTTITYSDPQNVCGVYTYTKFRSASGAVANLTVEQGAPRICLFVVE